MQQKHIFKQSGRATLQRYTMKELSEYLKSVIRISLARQCYLEKIHHWDVHQIWRNCFCLSVCEDSYLFHRQGFDCSRSSSNGSGGSSCFYVW